MAIFNLRRNLQGPSHFLLIFLNIQQNTPATPDCRASEAWQKQFVAAAEGGTAAYTHCRLQQAFCLAARETNYSAQLGKLLLLQTIIIQTIQA